MRRWRWDQGRLEYFKYENILPMARTLAALDNTPLDSGRDLLRAPLERATGLPFAPSRYKVWRNYARVFHCSMLATSVGGKLVATDLCKKLAGPPGAFSPDDYFRFVFSRFSLPFPAFDDYSAAGGQVFPFAAIIKFARARGDRGISPEELFSFVIGNGCTGLEDAGLYRTLPRTAREPNGDEERQVREMLVFMGQATFLKWFDRRLYADFRGDEAPAAGAAPFARARRSADPHEEFLAITSMGPDRPAHPGGAGSGDAAGNPPAAFPEGGRVFGFHGRIERSPMIRKRFFEAHPDIVCDACALRPRERYPWTDNILELHHLLPLAATFNVDGTTTSLDDLAPLCPSCHKSIHVFYRIKLKEWGLRDFDSKKMAKDVYGLAKREIRS